MDYEAPSTANTPIPFQTKAETLNDARASSSLKVTIAGCGGCGINLARAFQSNNAVDVKFFDTSMANTRPGEKAWKFGAGHGSGSMRAENAKTIESECPNITDDEIGKADAAIVVFGSGGGSGGVIGPLLAREYHRRGMRVICVVVTQADSLVSAKNTLNTLKSLSAIATKNDIYLPLVALSNDQVPTRTAVDQVANRFLNELVTILTTPTYEVDRNDRLNWISPQKVVGASFGIKILSFQFAEGDINTDVVIGFKSDEMVDSLLVLQNSPEEVGELPLPASRLKKMGFYVEKQPRLVGRVSSDISAINQVIDHVDKMTNMEKAQKHSGLDRLASSGDEETFL